LQQHFALIVHLAFCLDDLCNNSQGQEQFSIGVVIDKITATAIFPDTFFLINNTNHVQKI